MSGRLAKFARLLERWPIDATKPGRDLGEHLHKEIKTNSRKIAEKELDALQSIVDNVHCKAYPRTLKSSSTGMTTEECYIFLSEKGMKQINEKFGNKIATKIRTMF